MINKLFKTNEHIDVIEFKNLRTELISFCLCTKSLKHNPITTYKIIKTNNKAIQTLLFETTILSVAVDYYNNLIK